LSYLLSHKRLKELETYGKDGDVLKWIENWLADRKQRVVLYGHCSIVGETCQVVIPQGSVVGPLLLVIHINRPNIDETIPCKILKFADDTKIYSVVISATEEEKEET